MIGTPQLEWSQDYLRNIENTLKNWGLLFDDEAGAYYEMPVPGRNGSNVSWERNRDDEEFIRYKFIADDGFPEYFLWVLIDGYWTPVGYEEAV